LRGTIDHADQKLAGSIIREAVALRIAIFGDAVDTLEIGGLVRLADKIDPKHKGIVVNEFSRAIKWVRDKLAAAEQEALLAQTGGEMQKEEAERWRAEAERQTAEVGRMQVRLDIAAAEIAAMKDTAPVVEDADDAAQRDALLSEYRLNTAGDQPEVEVPPLPDPEGPPPSPVVEGEA